MAYTLLDGKVVSALVKDQIKENLAILKQKYSINCTLAIVMVGDNPASQVYVNSKKKACEYVGMQSVVITLDKTASEEQVISEVNKLANDKSINGIMVQMPLPTHLNANKIINCIPANKDVDGLTCYSEGANLVDEKGFIACTPKGIMQMLKHYDIQLEGKNAVVIGRSTLVGKPVAIRLLKENCTVTVCHSKTTNLASFTKKADILIVAIGKKHFITADMVKKGCSVVDVGVNRIEGKLYGDVDFENVCKKAKYISPVPGGVGLMTVAMLISNCYEACIMQNGVVDELLRKI